MAKDEQLSMLALVVLAATVVAVVTGRLLVPGDASPAAAAAATSISPVVPIAPTPARPNDTSWRCVLVVVVKLAAVLAPVEAR